MRAGIAIYFVILETFFGEGEDFDICADGDFALKSLKLNINLTYLPYFSVYLYSNYDYWVDCLSAGWISPSYDLF